MSIQFKVNDFGTISVRCDDEDGCGAVESLIDSMQLAFSHELDSNFFTITYSTILLTINKNDDSSDDDDELSAQKNESTKLKIVEALTKMGGEEVEHFSLESERLTNTPR